MFIIFRVVFALLTSSLLTLSFPSPDQGWLAWIALVPLIIACQSLSPVASFGLGLLSGMAAIFGVFYWIFEVPGFRFYHMLIGSFYFGLYPALWCAGFTLLSRTPSSLIVTGPALWVALDYLRNHAGFLALPWGALAQSQHHNLPIIQIATITGEYGVTFLVLMSSVAIANLIIRKAWRSLIIAGLVIILAHTWGFISLSIPYAAQTFRVAAVQPSILLSERRPAQGGGVTVARLERLTRDVAKAGPLLIAWPETAVRDLIKDPVLVERLQSLATNIDTSLIVGASEFVKLSQNEGKGSGKSLTFERRSYNSAYLITPEEPLEEPYRKMILLPFGEYLPMEKFIRWPGWLVPSSFKEIPGEARRLFKIRDGTQFAVLICWENLFSDFVRPSVREGAQLLVQLTNDNWFGRTAAPRQHNLASVFRAVENRVPVMTASNTGPSQIIDPFGKILASVSDLFSEGVAIAEVPLVMGSTFYTHFGDVFAYFCMVIVLGSIIIGFLRKK